MWCGACFRREEPNDRARLCVRAASESSKSFHRLRRSIWMFGSQSKLECSTEARQKMSLASEGKLKAPRGKFRVVGVDTFEGPDADYLIEDADSLKKARQLADQNVGDMNPTYVYDDKGEHVYSGKRQKAAGYGERP